MANTNNLLLDHTNGDGASKSPFCWWRTLHEFDENGNFKDDQALTPRLRLIRELERLSLIAGEGLDEVRHRLISYRAGDFCLPVGGIDKDEMDVPPLVTILLTGLTASGKSAFVNMLYSVLGRSGVIPFAQTSPDSSSDPTTMYLEEHNVVRSPRTGFCVYDTRGLDENQMDDGLEEVLAWMSNGVRHNQACSRPHDRMLKHLAVASTTRFVKRKVNCVMVVADLSQIHNSFKSGNTKPVQALRDLFHLTAINNSNEKPILILTHGDRLSAEERIEGRIKICEYLGIRETNGAYDIPCLTEQGIVAEESDPATAFAVTEAVYRGLLHSDRSHLPKSKWKDWIRIVLSWIMMSIAAVFAVLARFFSRFGHHDGKLKM